MHEKNSNLSEKKTTEHCPVRKADYYYYYYRKINQNYRKNQRKINKAYKRYFDNLSSKTTVRYPIATRFRAKIIFNLIRSNARAKRQSLHGAARHDTDGS